MERRNSGFLATVLGAGRRKDTADFPDQRAAHPQSAGLVEKRAHLSRHIAKARRCTKDDGIVIGQLVRCRHRCLLVKFDADGCCLFGRDGFSDTLERHVGAGDGSCAFGHCASHRFEVTVH